MLLMLPQLLGESNMSTASDVYSFGIIMYEMLTFKIPFEECEKALVRVSAAAHKSSSAQKLAAHAIHVIHFTPCDV